MRGTWAAALTVVGVLGVGLLVPSVATAAPRALPDTSVSFVSEAGDRIGEGATAHYGSTDSTITVSGTKAGVRFTVAQDDLQWDVHVVPGAGDTLHPGSYARAELHPFQTGRAPGLSFTGNGRYCSWASGSFVVDQIAFDATGAVSLADISLVQHCQDATPALSATLHYRALPLSFVATMPLNGAPTKTYTNGTSLFTVAPGGIAPGGMHFRVSGLGDTWDVSFAPPTGSTFVIGRRYVTNGGPADATHAALYVVDGTGCAANPGTLRVDHLVMRRGAILSLSVTFTAKCWAAQPAATGTIHYFA